MSQRRSTRAAVPAALIEEEEDNSLEEAVNECARYILCREASKIPIKRANIIKHLATVCQTPSGDVSRVISRTNKLLEKVCKATYNRQNIRVVDSEKIICTSYQLALGIWLCYHHFYNHGILAINIYQCFSTCVLRI